MFNVVDELLGVLDLERLEVNLFRGGSPRVNWTRVFGGQVVAQALVAACRTVEGRPPHSLHGYFLLGGDPKLPILYEVDRIRDGKTFATRRVNAIQQGRAIFSMAASFVVDEPGPDYQVAMPHVPPPEDLPNDAQVRQQLLARIPEQVRDYFLRERAIELHPVEYERYLGKKYPDGVHMWMRTKSPVPDDPILHQCILAYASDMTLLDAAMVPLG
ncbi:MAG: acyl-CoA thioesterase, partial [Pseudorhodoplanes sp.]